MEDKKPRRRICDVLPAEITGAPVIGMSGNHEITVDGFKGIEEYSESELSFRAGDMTISVCGEALVIRYLSLHTIVVCGSISRVEFAP